ncbi:MAG TPA: hypothetical protein VEY13_12080 [Rubrobacteraceae bacterium]|nr:hypothetical protein [Rubrobacteraceae bacterium]
MLLFATLFELTSFRQREEYQAAPFFQSLQRDERRLAARYSVKEQCVYKNTSATASISV